MPVKKLKEFLNANQVRYVAITHSPAFTAQEIAASAHIPGKELAKTVMVKLDGTMAMAVLPASCRVDFDLLKSVSGAESVELAVYKEGGTNTVTVSNAVTTRLEELRADLTRIDPSLRIEVITDQAR